jgi:hypothetical protein
VAKFFSNCSASLAGKLSHNLATMVGIEEDSGVNFLFSWPEQDLF